VVDAAPFPETPGVAQFLDLNTTSFDDYEYDAMGNLSQDRHKGVSMTYNHFNKPTEVQGSGEKIVYIYSADGTKLRQKVIDTENPALLKVTDYAGMYQYGACPEPVEGIQTARAPNPKPSASSCIPRVASSMMVLAIPISTSSKTPDSTSPPTIHRDASAPATPASYSAISTETARLILILPLLRMWTK